MKNIILIAVLLISGSLSAQAFYGKGDKKLQIGADFQNNATGLGVSYDVGIGQNLSVGLVANYALGLDDNIEADFDERSSLRVRLNANVGNVLNISPAFDVYPGLSLGTKNFGGHLGARYYLTDGFGVYSEVFVPLSKYDTGTLTAAEELYNQFVFSVGASFNLF